MTRPPCLDGWWLCCQCIREVNSVLCGYDCPDCAHTKCCWCSDFGGGSPKPKHPKPSPPGSASIVYISPPAMTTLVRNHYRAKSRQLSIFINGVLSTCCADSGSEVNCMTEQHARAIGAAVTYQVVLFNLPVTSRVLESVGVVQLMCGFPSSPVMGQLVDFFVFTKLQCQVIFGRQFLRATQTLDLYQHRLRIAENISPGPTVVRSVGQVEERVKCWLDDEQVWSLADTGASVNLISSRLAQILGYGDGRAPGKISNFARALGYGKKRDGKAIEYGDQIGIEFADCSTAMTEGTIQLTVSFSEPKAGNSIVHKLVESSGGRTSSHGEGLLHWKSKMIDTFYILRDLSYDAVLGETLLATIDAYNQHPATFRVSGMTEHSCIAIARRKKAKEGNAGTAIPLTPEQKFMDEFSLEHDRLLNVKGDIEERVRRGLVSEEQARARNFQADQDHLQWLNRNRELLEQYYPGYYNKHVPQEIA